MLSKRQLLVFLVTAALVPLGRLHAQEQGEAVQQEAAEQVDEAKKGNPDPPVTASTPDGVDSDSADGVEGEEPPMMTEEEAAAEFKRRVEAFRAKRKELETAIGDQRAIYIPYMNNENRTPAAKQAFAEQRKKTRRILDETYDAALEVIRFANEEEAATFMVTMIQHRFKHDIYGESTMEGAARLIDGGSPLTYLFQAAARSAVVEGRFDDLAKPLFESISEENKEEIDLTLEYNLDEYKEQFEAEKVIREKEAEEDRLPRVLIRTSQGDVVVELFLDQAPSHVSNFISLVEDGFYDDLDFYQVIDHLLALTGDQAGDGSGTSGKYLKDEHERPDARKAFRGSLVMAKVPNPDGSGSFVPHSASSQFAILYLPMVSVPTEQTIFGRVIEGMDAICRLRRVDPTQKKKKNELQRPPDRIIEATVLRRPEELPEPVYLDLEELKRDVQQQVQMYLEKQQQQRQQ